MTAGAASPITARSSSAAETRALAGALAPLVRPGDVVLLVGELGAGKTVFTKGLADALGIDEPVISPTFTLARRYEGRVPLVHVDVYRLGVGAEVFDLGLDDLADDDGVIVVEWGDLAAGFVRGDQLEVRLEALDADSAADDLAGDGPRLVTVTPRGGGWLARRADLVRVFSAAELGTGR
jgi:tRNA threonylcarbamoyladenosine biosynthesis protein TsaE